MLSGYKVLRCREHEPVPIPLAELIGPNGSLEINKQIAEKGMFDIDFRKGDLVLKSTKFVGLIPVTERFAILVEPRMPIRNLFYIVERSDSAPVLIRNLARGYISHASLTGDVELAYIEAFASQAARLLAQRPTKRFVPVRGTNLFKGRLLFAQSIRRYYAKGIRGRHDFEKFELTFDHPAHRCIKYVAIKLRRYALSGRRPVKPQITQSLSAIIQRLSSVDSDTRDDRSVQEEAISLARNGFYNRPDYAEVLWLCYLVCSKRSVRIEDFGSAYFRSVCINVAEVFEGYIRYLLNRASAAGLLGGEVKNGNTHPVRLFRDDGSLYSVHPDYYVRDNGVAKAVLDAKYKPAVATSDRYELLAFCEALGVRRGAFICPKVDQRNRLERVGTTSGGKSLASIYFDLNASDLVNEEQAFVAAVAGFVSTKS